MNRNSLIASSFLSSSPGLQGFHKLRGGLTNWKQGSTFAFVSANTCFNWSRLPDRAGGFPCVSRSPLPGFPLFFCFAL